MLEATAAAQILQIVIAVSVESTNQDVLPGSWGQLGPRSYLLDKLTEHLGFAATKAAIKSMQKDSRPASSVLIEARANGDAIIEELKSDPEFGAAVVVRTASAFPAVRHDDDVDSFSQFLNWRRSRSLQYGVLDHAKRIMKDVAAGIRDQFGVLIHPPAKPVLVPVATKAFQVQVDNYKLQQAQAEKPKPKCRICQSTLVQPLGGPRNLHCNQCATDFLADGTILHKADETTIGVSCCDHPLSQPIGDGRGTVRCGNCGRQGERDARLREPRGMSRADYFRTHGGFMIAGPRDNWNAFGRFR